MFELRRHPSSPKPDAWEYRPDPCWTVWQRQDGDWRVSLNADAPVSTRHLIAAIQQDDRHLISRQSFASRRQAARYLKRTV